MPMHNNMEKTINDCFMNFSKNIVLMSNERGMSFKDLAAQAGISPSCLSLIIKGKRKANCESALKIALALGTTLDRLYGLEC